MDLLSIINLFELLSWRCIVLMSRSRTTSSEHGLCTPQCLQSPTSVTNTADNGSSMGVLFNDVNAAENVSPSRDLTGPGPSDQIYNNARRTGRRVAGLTMSSSAPSTPQINAASAMVHALFGSDNDTLGPCWGDFECSHARIPGRLYAVTSGILFYSNFLGFERRLCLRFIDMISLSLHRTTSLRIELQITVTDPPSSSSNAGEYYIFRSFASREQVLRLLIGLKRLADERLSCKPRQISMSTQSERYIPRELTSSFYNATIDQQADQDRRGETHSAEVEQSTPSRINLASDIEDSCSTTPTPPRLRRAVMSDDHLEASGHRTHTTTNSDPPMIFNRRRAVSDSLVRFLGLDEKDRLLPATEQDQWLDTMGQTSSNCSPIAATTAPTTTETIDTVKEAWDVAVVQAKELEEIGIESLHLHCSLDTFYRMFLADEAPFSFARFQREHIRDHNVVVTLWEPEQNDDCISQQIRTLSFTHPIRKGVGPTEAHTRRRQVVRRFGMHGITFQNTTHVEGIPAADCFSVHDFWIVSPVIGEVADPRRPAITVSMRFAPRFTKRTLFRSVIERNIKRECKEWCAHFETMARAALQEAAAGNLNEAPERSGISSIVQPDESAATGTGTGMEQKCFILSPSWHTLYPVVVVVLLIVVLVLVVLILLLLQTREAMSILRQDMAALHLENQQLLHQQWMMIAAQQQLVNTDNTTAASSLPSTRCMTA